MDSRYYNIKALPEPLRAALASVGFRKGDLMVKRAESVSLSSCGSKGRQGFAVLMKSCQDVLPRIYMGSWGGPNPWSKSDNPVDSINDQPRTLQEGEIAITGTCGVYAVAWALPGTDIGVPETAPGPCTLHPDCTGHGSDVGVNVACAESGTPLNAAELKALACFGLKSGYRQEAVARLKCGAYEDLKAKFAALGYLEVNRAGAAKIVAKGRNVLLEYKVSTYY